MSATQSIQRDLAFPYKQAVICAVRCALRQTHGAVFAACFVREHRAAILVAAKGRIRGDIGRTAESEAIPLAAAGERL